MGFWEWVVSHQELPIAPHAGVSFRGVDHKVVCEEGGKTTPLETLSGKLLS